MTCCAHSWICSPRCSRAASLRCFMSVCEAALIAFTHSSHSFSEGARKIYRLPPFIPPSTVEMTKADSCSNASAPVPVSILHVNHCIYILHTVEPLDLCHVIQTIKQTIEEEGRGLTFTPADCMTLCDVFERHHVWRGHKGTQREPSCYRAAVARFSTCKKIRWPSDVELFTRQCCIEGAPYLGRRFDCQSPRP